MPYPSDLRDLEWKKVETFFEHKRGFCRICWKELTKGVILEDFGHNYDIRLAKL